ncbi:MAG: STAS domain-containing protein [Candidatus Sedimenticola sp. (ex Thyasira tokunagai)]
MKFSISQNSGFHIVTLSGDVDLSSSPRARDAILQSLNKGHVMVDLSAVEYIDSSGVASLVEGYQTAKDREVKFGLIGVSPSALLVLQLAHLDRVFTIHDSLDEAVVQEPLNES